MARLPSPPAEAAESRYPIEEEEHEVRSLRSDLFVTLQEIIRTVYARQPPGPTPFVPLGRIAIIGAGVTGVSSAAHCVSHGFEVVLFEKKGTTGGVWTDVNSTSALQINSLLYRFHPSILFSGAFPKQAEILGQVHDVWERYGLQRRTRFNYDVKRVQRCTISGKIAWSINDGSEGFFDGLIVAIGTCAQPYERRWPSRSEFKGDVLHSSELDRMRMPGQVAVIGSGASAVEAVETALQRGARHATIIARNDKWIVSRSLWSMFLIGSIPWGWSSPFDRFWMSFLKKVHYRDLAWMAPTPNTGYGLNESTPIVNDDFLELIREGSANYIRGKVESFAPDGLRVLIKGESVPTLVEADVVIDATGFQRPSMGFIPSSLFPSGYELPALFLHHISVDEPTVIMTNSGYEEAIGVVGFLHIGIYARMLMMFLIEPELAPDPKNMRLWVDLVRCLKSGGPTDAFHFFTYAEMLFCLLLFHIIKPRRMRWALFNFYGFGSIGSRPRGVHHKRLEWLWNFDYAPRKLLLCLFNFCDFKCLCICPRFIA